MSAQPEQQDDNTVNIEVDGQALTTPKGSMIIQATDQANIHIPRFCYHHKLSIAANCRMCLVDVEMNGKPAPKPLPACATPVSEGMKIATQSERTLSAQRNVMEFLLINHPLDCPVCDQGGECELQDLALGFGRGISRFTEGKRSVADEDIGPLIGTYMTRCIHCTRCVRFMREHAGTNELGGMGRTEDLEIGTYIGKSIESEIGGNIIDLCPVGALTDKPFQFRARPWDLIARPSISYHDALGSNLWLHTRRGEVLRTVPRDNEAINECWLADRDRYSRDGMYVDDRLLRPRVKRDGKWAEASWDEALEAAETALKSVNADDLGILAQPATSCEEGELLKRMARGVGTPHIDHRLRQQDFADNPRAHAFDKPVAELDTLAAGLIVGADTRSEMPLLHHRLRQSSYGFRRHAAAANRNRFDVTEPEGAALHVVNPARFGFNFDLASETVVAPQDLVDATLALAAAAAEASGKSAPDALAADIRQVTISDTARTAIKDLSAADNAVVLMGAVAAQHPQASWLRAATRFVADATGTAFNEIPDGANAIGLAGQNVLPGTDGLDAQGMLAEPRRNFVLFGAEPPHDFADGAAAMKALRQADHVIAFAAFASPALLEVADVLLPIALLPESEATATNVDGISQQLDAGSRAPGDARNGWKVLRALGGAMEWPGFTFTNVEQLRESMAVADSVPESTRSLATRDAQPDAGTLVRLASIPIYRADAVLRRTESLNAHPLNRSPDVRLNPTDAERLGLAEDDMATVADVTLPVTVEDAVPAGCAWIEAGHDTTATLPPNGASLTVSKA